MIAISANGSEFVEQLRQKLEQAKNPVAVLLTAGRELGNQLKTWFRKKDETPNKLAPDRRTHFWLQMSRSVQNPIQQSPTTVTVSVNDPRIAQKVFGGPIVAKAAGALTVPVNEKAYGRTAATFEAETGLKLFVLGKKDDPNKRGGLLVAKVDGQIEVEYVLTKRVDQDADPTALPPMEDLKKAILERAQKVIDRQASEASNRVISL